MRAVLRSCPDELDSLGVRETRVSDALLAELDGFNGFDTSMQRNSAVTEQALRPFASARPGFKRLAIRGIP